MVDKNTFMETVRSVREIARTSPDPMDRAEMMSYFTEMDLSPEQEEMVYQFLMMPAEEQGEPDQSGETDDAESWEGPDQNADQEDAETAEANGEPAESADSSTHFQMYLDEVNEITELEDETEERLYRGLLSGDDSVIPAISTQWLKRIVAIAEGYRDRGCLMDDLVQEGNMGLLMELHAIAKKAAGQTGQPEKPGQPGKPESAGQQAESIREQLQEAVKAAIEQYLGDESGAEQQNETILGKVSLVHAAQKFLTEEKGEKPSLQELAAYTRIPVEEITDILALVKKK